MQVLCQHCQKMLEFSGDRPSFCAYCGQALSQTVLAATQEYHSEAPTEPPDFEISELIAPPTAVGGYQLLRPLGTGGMGTVYEAEEASSGRKVALKLIAAEFARAKEAVQRFRQEGRLASTIVHPRCVFVLAAEEEAGRPYIVMELMPGATLKDLMEKGGPLPVEEALAKTLDVIEGLQEAHRLGVIHRDVKPSNCFLEENGRVKIGDFGLAKSLVGDSHLTRTGTFLGTPLFASPEQIRKDPVDQQTDVYSVAATLYYLLTGRAPFETSDSMATLARVMSEPPPSMRKLRPNVSSLLDKVVLRGLERERTRRWRTLEEFRAALAPFLPRRTSIGGLGMRIAAYLLDAALIILCWIILTAVLGPWIGDSRLSRLLEEFVVALPYFTLCEGVWGATLGKRMLRLRVFTADGQPPALPRALLRTVLFFTFVSLGYVTQTLLTLDQLEPEHARPATTLGDLLLNFLPFLWAIAGAALLGSTMRARNGYRGLHEFLSGTRVVHFPWPRKRRTFGACWPRLPPRQLPELPAWIGPFAVRGVLRQTGAEWVLLGEDLSLGRQVWLWLRPTTEPALSATRRDLGRSTRLRWLAGGTDGDQQWDAFLASAGCSLPDLLALEGPLTWTDTRALLEEFTEELVAACRDGTLPPLLTVEQLWVRETGGVRVLDFPLAPPAEGVPLAAGETDSRKALALLRHMAALALEGRVRPADQAPTPIHAPVPGHAVIILNRLLALEQRYSKPEQLEADLAATHDQPTEITRRRRVAHLVVLLFLLMAGMVSAMIISTAAWWARFGKQEIDEDWLVKSVALMVPLLSVLASFFCRGGLSFRMVGIAVVRADGTQPSRWRCAWRAVLTWLPVTALDWALVDLPEESWWIVLPIGPLYATLALWRPNRSPADRLAGTQLVPR